MYKPIAFEITLRNILGLERELCSKTIERRCRSFIGVSFEVCADVWKRITLNRSISKKAKPKHLIWALRFLFLYETDDVRATELKADIQTIKEWTEDMLDAIMTLKKEVVSSLELHSVSLNCIQLSLKHFTFARLFLKTGSLEGNQEKTALCRLTVQTAQYLSKILSVVCGALTNLNLQLSNMK